MYFTRKKSIFAMTGFSLKKMELFPLVSKSYRLFSFITVIACTLCHLS